MMFDQRFRLRPAPAPAGLPASLVQVSEEGAGVFVASCQRCGHVVGVRHTRVEAERDRAMHRCGDAEASSPLRRYCSLT